MKVKEIIARHNALIKGVIDQVYPPKLNYILSRNMKKASRNCPAAFPLLLSLNAVILL